MKKYLKYFVFMFIFGFMFIPKSIFALDNLDFNYQTHIQNIGWMNTVSNGAISGTTGRSLRLEAIKINVNGYDNPITYSTYVENSGWQTEVGSGNIAGTTGQSRRIEAFKINLSDELSSMYDIYYRVHVSYMGWLGWAKNGEASGAVGYGYNLEAIQIVVVPKDSAAPGNVNDHYREANLKVNTSSHVSYEGWQNYVTDGKISGTTGQSKRVEAVRLTINKKTDTNGIAYSTYVKNAGWQNEVGNGAVSGTTGQSKTIEAIKIRLTGDLENQYDIYYRVHVAYMGWLGWTKNGEAAGAVGYGYNIEAVQVVLVEKDGIAPGSTDDYYREVPLKVNYTSHVSYVGWQSYVSAGSTSGKVGNNVEAIRLSLNKPTTNTAVKYSTYMHNKGWSSESSNGTMSGTTGQNGKIEAIKISLSDNLAEAYDIYYRVYISGIGWLDWTSNGGAAGYVGYNKSIQAYQVVLVTKGEAAPGETTNPYYEREASVSYQTHISYIGWQGIKSDGELSGTTGQSNRIEAIKINVNSSTIEGGIEYSAHVQNVGWMDFVSNGAIGGTTGQGLRLEAIKIRLTGALAEQYDVYYRVHVQNYGWLDWTSNGNPAGTRGAGLRMEAIQIQLVKKGDATPGNGGVAYKEGKWEVKDGYTYYYDINGNMANDFIVIDGSKYFFNSLGHLLTINAKQILDLSQFNTITSWSAIKNHGVDGVILRAAGSAWGRGYTSLSIYDDSKFEENIQGAKSVGLPISLYYFSAATTVAEAEQEAAHLISKADYMKEKYGITAQYLVYDVEYASDNYGNTGRHNDISRATRTAIIRAFVNKITAAGYKPMLYAGQNIINNTATGIDLSQLLDVPLWYARYGSHYPTGISYPFVGWQYNSKETVSGVSGYVDSSVFGDFV